MCFTLTMKLWRQQTRLATVDMSEITSESVLGGFPQSRATLRVLSTHYIFLVAAFYLVFLLQTARSISLGSPALAAASMSTPPTSNQNA